MPYRFSATTGNIVRPIEAVCLNTTTGALITPLKYGPAGSAITMWNGVVESYSSETFYKPVSRAGSGFNGTNAYDGTGTPGTTTTAANLNSVATATTTRYETYTFSGATAYTKFKLYLTYDWELNPFTSLCNDKYYGSLGIEYSLNGTTWVKAPVYPEFGGGSTTYASPIDLGTLASTTITNFKVRFVAQSTRFIYDENDPFTYSYATCGFIIRDVYIGAQ